MKQYIITEAHVEFVEDLYKSHLAYIQNAIAQARKIGVDYQTLIDGIDALHKVMGSFRDVEYHGEQTIPDETTLY